MAGDSGGFVNAVHREGSNLAMTTGRLAAETIIALKAAGKPMSAANLAAYKASLDQSFVMKDLEKYEDVADLFMERRQILNLYPKLLADSARKMLTVDGMDKRSKQREIAAAFREKRSLWGLLGDAWKFWRAFK
jgi:electron transfer flavoprotein-quinone oxidoreductase